jgi:hypothetical protein
MRTANYCDKLVLPLSRHHMLLTLKTRDLLFLKNEKSCSLRRRRISRLIFGGKIIGGDGG